MTEFIQYVVSEMKSKRLSKETAASLIKQFVTRTRNSSSPMLHPLVHRNTSEFDRPRFSSTFVGDEFFLRDHQVRAGDRPSDKVLPGVAYLEMARAAIEKAMPRQEAGRELELRNVVWAQPIVVSGETSVGISLSVGDEEEIEYEVYSEEEGGEERIHCQGRAEFSASVSREPVPLAQLQGQMSRGRLEPKGVYEAFTRIGLVYGPSFQSIEELHLGDGQLLAKLKVPSAAGLKDDRYGLHPSVMDGALQASIGLLGALSGESVQARLPFALESLRVVSACTGTMWAWVRYAPGSRADDAVTKLDIDLSDEHGAVCVEMRGFSSRLLSKESAGAWTPVAATSATLLATAQWRAGSAARVAVSYAQRQVLVCETGDGSQLQGLLPGSRCVGLGTVSDASRQGSLAERYERCAVQCFEQVRGILQSKVSGPVLVQVVVRVSGAEGAVFAGLAGLLKTAALENPQIHGQLILSESPVAQLALELEEDRGYAQDVIVRHAGGQREVLGWQVQEPSKSQAPIAFKDGGVYLITGGLGGLGRVFAREIFAQTSQARVIVTGRGELDEGKQRLLKELESLGAVQYRSVELGDARQVRGLVAGLVSEHGQLNGIVHSAGMIADNFILKKSAAEFAQVLGPKVHGTYALDEASATVELDFLVLFSSVAGALGNVGQADYAAGNGFMDGFAAYRNERVTRGERHGRTLSINWPLWEAGGMRIEASTQALLEQSTGLKPLATAAGLEAFYQSLALTGDQALVLYGAAGRLLDALEPRVRATPPPSATAPTAAPAPMPAAIESSDLLERTQDYLRKQLSQLLKLPAHQIDSQAPLEQYGIDSILAMNLTNQLEKTFGSLSKTLFFEYRSLRELSVFFIERYSARLLTLIAPAQSQVAPTSRAADTTPRLDVQKIAIRRAARRPAALSPDREKLSLDVQPIAIVGLSGRYPESADVEAYWSNLRDGKNCIVEVPAERWDWHEYFSADRTKEGWHYSKWGGFIEGVDEFDPLFFNISPREAKLMDPQERLFLQHAWMAVEDAGYTRSALQAPHVRDLPGQVGVYVGVMYSEYQLFAAEASARGQRMGVVGSYASIANRVSYLLNLHGPSMTLDTMCSSSLTAIHIACQDLRLGRTSLAIAGGVNVSIHPNKYLTLSAGQFISSEGQCQSFGEGGDGYIPGEGVGAVVLKRLSEAERNGDHIYGIIRGSALSHGGKTNGYTVPNPQAQTSAINRALSEARVDARHISYIEAHGTGTKLGDPIEIAALAQAFHQHTEERGFCALGSAKSNIGHCESAAGIAGLTKILLQMRHQQIVPSLHSARLNPHIDFAKTPFVVNQTLRAWERPVIEGRTIARIAGISSFGAGGSNAHMLIEEYRAPVQASRSVPGFEHAGGVIIVLSARTPEQLQHKARDLLEFIGSPAGQGVELVSMAYTLQVGREAMEERLGLLVLSIEQLQEKLGAYVGGERALEDVYQGQVKRNQEGMILISQDDDMKDAIDRWMARKKLTKLLDLWVKGLELDWEKLYGQSKPQRISLPTYPFAKERYWIDVSAAKPGAHSAVSALLHPLLHANASDFSQQIYTSIFNGEEFFLSDHQLRMDGATSKILPAVAYLEMVRAAVSHASNTASQSSTVEISNVVWAQPFVFSDNKELHIALREQGSGEVDYEIFSDGVDEDVVHCQGRVLSAHEPVPATLPLEQLQGQMTRERLEPKSVYEAFTRIGLMYGPSFQSIEELHLGDGQLLAKLQVPNAAGLKDDRYGLHPSVMDGALQASIGLLGALTGESVQARLPFALESLRVVSVCTGTMWAWVRHAPGSRVDDAVTKLDIDLADEHGAVCVEMRGFSSRLLSKVNDAPRDQTLDAPSEASPDVPPPSVSESTDLLERTQDYLRKQLSQLLKLPAHEIDSQAPLEQYGIDSVLAMNLTNQLEKSFGSLSKTLFFEFQTLRELSEYFVSAHSSHLATLLVSPASIPRPTAMPLEPELKPSESRRLGRRRGVAVRTTSDPIAIVGLSGRYPESADVEAYWSNLRDGKNCIVEVPAERWDWHEYFSADRTKEGWHYSKWGGFIEGVDEFDPLFFNISPREAKLMDPQERLFLQHAWMAVEDAGYTRSALQAPHVRDLPGQVGVYVGVMYSEYQLFAAEASARGQRMGVVGSYASIANRVSYLLNLHGPSMTLDTMCSSSLTAIHIACQDLRLGRTSLAIAGGVNVSIHPNKYLTLSAGQFISSEGQCQSFGEGGDGYIPGEGVGAVVLKRLSEAERNGDHIYGIIRGSALSHGGKTNGYTVPNPQAQTSAINRALSEARVDARHISYIEAHGTGTKLGDPIEIAALAQAFHQHTEERGFCALGSAKSNIGHCESAAGIAGLTKILLQMRHQQIVPSLHSARLNPHIDFAKTPFVVNQTLRAWERPVIEGRTIARIAGISSFGAGGSNAHMLIEEYRAPVQASRSVPGFEHAGGVIIVLSARTPEQLQHKARDLLEFIGSPAGQGVELVSMAYTLQVGREAMEERLGLLVLSIEQLQEKLGAYVGGERALEDVYQGQVKRNQEGMILISQDDDMKDAIDRWMARKKLTKLLDLWVKGLELDWEKLYGQSKPQRISLPTYPFAKERYWIDVSAAKPGAQSAVSALLHPLLHTNTSDLFQQSYRSTFSGEEFFLADHRVKKPAEAAQRVLPAVAYLEMARAAIEKAMPRQEPGRELELRNVVWAQPIVVSGETIVGISLSVGDEEEIEYEVYSEEEGGEERIHCQGRAEFSASVSREPVPLAQLQGQMSRGRLEPKGVYEAFTRIGLVYGPSFQSIEELHLGDGQLLAKLKVPSAAGLKDDRYGLHPSVMDGALQASIGLLGALSGESVQARLPFALESLRVVSVCTGTMWAWVRYAPGSRADDAVTKLDIDLSDEHGAVCVEMRGFSSRLLSKESAGAWTPVAATPATLLATAQWRAGSAARVAVSYAQRQVLVCETGDWSQLQGLLPGSRCVGLGTVSDASRQGSLAERYERCAVQCFEQVRGILQSKVSGPVLVQVVVRVSGAEGAVFAGLAGLLKTAALENPQIHGQLILSESPVAQLALELEEDRGYAQDVIVRHAGGQREVLGWQVQEPSKSQAPIAFKDGGVYLITGGLGGLGRVFAREIFAQTSQARVIVTGRGELDEGKQRLLKELESLGAVQYRSVELGDARQVRGLVAGLVSEHGQLNGIVHSAGMIADNFILKKSAAEFAQVLGPKVHGTYALDEASATVELDFLVLFSSVAGALGNVGQADYAAGNGFMDGFAAYRNERVTRGERHGRTLSINWPLWEAGGMRIEASTQALLEQSTGLKPLATAAGLEAFYQSLALTGDQALVLYGAAGRLTRTLERLTHQQAAIPEVVVTHIEPTPTFVATDSPNLIATAEDYLREQFSDVLQIAAHQIDSQAPLEHYGMDSVLAMSLTHRLEKSFGSLSKTLFFEYQTIAALAGYFAAVHPVIIEKNRKSPGAAHAVPAEAQKPSERKTINSVTSARGRFLSGKAADLKEIAIVGMSGKYPLADDLSQFWENLKTGRDCITEIPKERWDSDRFFDPERNKAGKSYGKWGGFISDVDKFDPLFFNMSPKEAAMIDPQERLFLETVWQTVEDAGYSKQDIAASRMGVFVGVMWGHYQLFGADALHGGNAAMPASSHASIANRVSYFFNFQGPSIALDTMCSSSLTAIHLASEEIRRGTIDAAIAGGVNVSIHPQKYLSLSQGNFLASDGRCRSFGEGGDGYVPGEGVGAVLLKPLETALRDGDHIYAVLKASSVNHGGKTNGYSVPNPNAQAELIKDVLKKAKIDPNTVSYIETHGTGTSLGDPIEVAGLSKAFGGSIRPAPFCAIGSVKSNIGHLESAAGIAAVTKTLLQIKHGQLVPSLHADRLNPNIDFAASPFYVQTHLTDWKPSAARPRRVCVSSFGAGGSNAHLILEDYIEAVSVQSERAAGTPELYILSARDSESLLRYADHLALFLKAPDTVSLADMAYTSQIGRTALNARLAVIASDTAELQRRLLLWIENRRATLNRPVPFIDADFIFEGDAKAHSNSGSLIDGESGKAFIRDLLSRRDLGKIAQCWTMGVDIDWRALQRHVGPKRVSIPTYPFAKERYWVETVALGVAQAPPRQQVVPDERIALFCPEWRIVPLTRAQTPDACDGTLLVIDASEELCTALLKCGGQDIVFVKWGSCYEETAPNRYEVDPDREEDFSHLLDSLKSKGQVPSWILHHTPETHDLLSEVPVDRQLSCGVYALLFLCKALMRHKPREPLKLLSAFSSCRDSGATLNGAIGGFYRSLMLEDPRFIAATLEFRQSEPGTLTADAKASLILQEFRADAAGSVEICYDSQAADPAAYVRQVRSLKPMPAFDGEAASLPLRREGVYVITGGLGGIGLIVGEYLVSRFAAKLVLVGRSVPSLEQQRQLKHLEAYGTGVLYLRADVAQMDDVQSVMRDAKARFGEVNGVIHAAGTRRDSFVLRKTREDMEAVLSSKVLGTLNLDQATADHNLDWFVLFSSVAGQFGNLGQADYAYGNRFLDCFAEAREAGRRTGRRCGRTLSISWPLWADGGMSLTPEEAARMEQRSGMNALPSAVGINVLEGLLCSSHIHAVALFGQAEKIRSYVSRHDAGRGKTEASIEPPTDDDLLRQRTTAYLQALIAGETGLSVERVAVAERFESFGVDSVMIGRFNANLERDLGTLPKTLLYEHESIVELTGYLLQTSRNALIQLFAAQPAATTVDPSLAAVASEPQEAEAALPVPPAEMQKAVSAMDRVAIVGMHGSYPHSPDLETFWENLKDGKDLVDLVPADRWDYEEYFHPHPDAAAEGKIYCKWGGFLEDFDKFDPLFFNISADEARVIDPQERLFLGSVWGAIENAGYTREGLRERFPKGKSADVGVFVGVTTSSYQLLEAEERSRGNHASPSALPWSIANRVSYFFDFSGPSMPIDTACSSSLVAVHLACESLRNAECQVAIAGGVNLYLHPSKYRSLCRRRMLSLAGKCRSYGAGDDGFVPAEGVGTLVLKRLEDAIADGDHIHAVIRGSAFEHSGRSNGYSAPNPNSQASLIDRTLRKAEINPETIGYIEGHGTGTQLGDSLEVAALTQAFQKQSAKTRYCPLGSVKGNMGHAESAAGIAGLAKVILQLKHRQLVPTLHSDEVNPNIDFEQSPFYLQHECVPWQSTGSHPRRALVNSFGAGGVNACVLLEEYEEPASPMQSSPQGPWLFVLSAKNEQRLGEYVEDWCAFLQHAATLDLGDLCHTLQIGREAMEERAAILCTNTSDLIAKLQRWNDPREPGTLRGNVDPRFTSKIASRQRDAEAGTGEPLELAEAARRWVLGERVNWARLRTGPAPRRIPLPTYPFEKRRYWVSDSVPRGPSTLTGPRHAHLHPLLSHNSSTLKEVSFTSQLSERAYYATDHLVNGLSVFPGAGFLEMACISGTIAGEQSIARIRDIVWIQPLTFEHGPQSLRTFLKYIGDSAEFAITSLDEDHDRVVHSEGRLYFKDGDHASAHVEETVTLEKLKQAAISVQAGASFYKNFEKNGLRYGESFQSVQEIHVGESWVLSHLTVAHSLIEDFGHYILHPSIIDGALQTVAGFFGGADAAVPHLPFALDEVDIIRSIPHDCYAYVELSDSEVQARADVKKFNIRLLNERGDVLVKLKNLYVRAVGKAATSQPSPLSG